MATKKKTPKDEKFEKQDFDLFEAITAVDNKDYEYFDNLTPEQQRKFSSYMMLRWISSVSGNRDMQLCYLRSTNIRANMYMFNEVVMQHPKLQWLMLCASSPGMGKQYHKWIPYIKEKVSNLKEVAVVSDVKDYYQKIYPNIDDSLLTELSDEFVKQQKRKVRLAELFPNLKFSDIETLNDITTDEELKKYEEESGN